MSVQLRSRTLKSGEKSLYLDILDEPGKLSHPRRMKVSSVNQLLGFDLSVG